MSAGQSVSSSLARLRARFDRSKEVPPWLLVWLVATVLLFVQRFAHWDGVAFISDEAAFLNTAREEVATNTWVSASPLYGTQGLRYGPSVLWFYAVVQRLFGDDVRASIAAMCFLVTLAHALAVLGVARAFKLSALEVLVLSAFVASSSYQMFWSRLAWDQLVNVCGSMLVLVLAASTLTVWHAVGMGLLIGVALSSHLFSAPLVVCVFFVMLFEHWHQPRRALLLGTVITAIVLLVNYPYFLFVLNDESKLTSQPGSFSLSGIYGWLVKPAQVAGFAGFGYFFDGEWNLLLARLGAGYAWLSESQIPAVLTFAALLGLCLGVGKSHGEGASRLARLSLVTWLFYTWLYDYRGLASHPPLHVPVLVGRVGGHRLPTGAGASRLQVAHRLVAAGRVRAFARAAGLHPWLAKLRGGPRRYPGHPLRDPGSASVWRAAERLLPR